MCGIFFTFKWERLFESDLLNVSLGVNEDFGGNGNLGGEIVEFWVSGNFWQIENCPHGDLNVLNVLNFKWKR